MDNENAIIKDNTGTLYFTNNGNGFFAPENISNEEYDKISKEIDNSQSLLKEDEQYIYSDEFIENFGDWQKAQRLEKLKNAESLETDARIILNEEDITDTVVTLIENEDRKSIQSLEKEIGKTVVGKYENRDTGLTFNVSNRNVTEISNHHYLWREHIKAISLIPQLSESAIFIGEEDNEDKKRNPNIVTYKYFATGIRIDNEDYTCKVVIGVDDNKNCYYDQSLSTIEKGKLIDILQKKNKLETNSPQKKAEDSFELTKEVDNNLSPLMTQREAISSYIYYDKRLITICQVPQMPYLDNNLIPTKETIAAVKQGLLYIEKSGQQYFMIDKTKEMNLLNVINRSSWTYFDSENISTIVYDVEISKDLYDNLLPESYNNRSINDNEIACIEYRKSMLTSDQDQFLISKFDRNDFTLKQQKEIQINDELKSQIRNVCDVYEKKQSYTNDLFKDFQFDFSRPVTWHFVDNTSLIYADTFISNEQALSLFNAAGARDFYNEDMQYCIQYRCTSTDKNNLVYPCKYDPNVEITTPLKEINLPEDIIKKVMSGVEAGIEEHLQQQHTIPDYLLDAVGYGNKRVVQEEVSDYSTDSNKPEGIMYLSENHNVFYAKPDLPREEYLKLSAQTDIDELKKQQSFLYTDENDDFGYQSNILEQREVYQHKIDRLQAKIDSLNGVPNPLNEIISSQLPASMTSLHSFTEEERMGQFIGMKNDFKNYATEEEIKLLDDKFKTLFVDPESSVEIKKGEEFHLLADEFESFFQDTKNKHYNVASNQYESYADVAFEPDKRSVEQEPVPDFAMVTQNGLQKFTGYYIQAYSDKNDIYTLSNGSNTIELPGETIKELNKPNLNEINFHGEVYSHILDHQYNDFFKYREPNIAAYFEHNLAVMIRTQAQNPLDTFKAAKEIIKAMPKNEQKITQELVKKIAASQNKSVNDLMLDMYNKAIIERPMNEEFINVNNPRNIIPRHMTDLVYITGHKIDDNSELRIGENINKVPVKAFKLNGKKQTIYLNLEVVSASKDKNLIVMKDSKENIYELPRDKILSQYEKNSIYNRRNQSVSVKHYNDSSMER